VIDLLVGAAQYGHHLDPLWEALPEEVRGKRVIGLQRERGPKSVPLLVASHLDMLRGRKLGYHRFVYVEHGIGQSYSNGNPAYPGGRDRGDVLLFLSPNERAAEADRKIYPRLRYAVVGDPRLDTLPTRQPGWGLTVAISFHWECVVAPESRSALPHFKPALARLRAAGLRLIGHGHPKAAHLFKRLWQQLDVEWVPEFDEVCKRADLYVCDNSSTLYEFASTDRPVVVMNAPWYRRDVHHGLRFWEAATVGLQVDAPDALLMTIQEALADKEDARADRQAALDIVYAYRNGAAQRGAAAIVDLVG
jgi:hypothetical protein